MEPLSTQAETESGSLLDRAFGTLNSTVDLWQRWQSAKVENMQAKAAIPSTVVAPGVASGVSQKTLLYVIGGIVVAVIGYVLFFGRKAAA